jgi:YggT family protein
VRLSTILWASSWSRLPTGWSSRLIPSAFGFDLASLFGAWLTQLAFHALVFTFSATALTATPSLLGVLVFVAALETVRLALYLIFGVVIITALLSWINPHAPLAPVFNAIASPFLYPLQRIIPLVGGVDLSPLVLLLGLQVLLSLLAYAKRSLMTFFF